MCMFSFIRRNIYSSIRECHQIFRKRSTSTSKYALLKEISPKKAEVGCKITIIGAGHVGTACALILLTRGVCDSILLFDNNKNKVNAEVMDLQHGSLFAKNSRVNGTTEYEDTYKSKILILTAGVARSSTKQTMFSLAQQNTIIFQDIIPKLLKYSPDAIFIVVTEPVDVMTYVTWKLSDLPVSNIIGVGNSLDTSRFRIFLAKRLGLPALGTHAYIIGEYGPAHIPVWSTVNVCGIRLRELNPAAGTEEDPEKWNEISGEVLKSRTDILNLKGHVCWAPAANIYAITNSIIKNQNSIHCVSANINGLHGVDFNIFLSLPCVLNMNGIQSIVKQKLESAEREKFLQSAHINKKILRALKIY